MHNKFLLPWFCFELIASSMSLGANPPSTDQLNGMVGNPIGHLTGSPRTDWHALQDFVGILPFRRIMPSVQNAATFGASSGIAFGNIPLLSISLVGIGLPVQVAFLIEGCVGPVCLSEVGLMFGF